MGSCSHCNPLNTPSLLLESLSGWSRWMLPTAPQSPRDAGTRKRGNEGLIFRCYWSQRYVQKSSTLTQSIPNIGTREWTKPNTKHPSCNFYNKSNSLHNCGLAIYRDMISSLLSKPLEALPINPGTVPFAWMMSSRTLREAPSYSFPSCFSPFRE